MNAPALTRTQQKENSLLFWKASIERAIRDADLMTFEDIRKGVLEERYLYFDTGRAFAVIEFQQYTKGNVCLILASGGSLKGLRDLQEKLIPFFKLIGARRLVQAGRLGWAKILPAWGWQQKHVLMQLEIV